MVGPILPGSVLHLAYSCPWTFGLSASQAKQLQSYTHHFWMLNALHSLPNIICFDIHAHEQRLLNAEQTHYCPGAVFSHIKSIFSVMHEEEERSVH
jgi:hypothetical protein